MEETADGEPQESSHTHEGPGKIRNQTHSTCFGHQIQTFLHSDQLVPTDKIWTTPKNKVKFKVPLSCHIAEFNACGQHLSCSLWRQHPHDMYILLVCIRSVEKAPSSQALVLTVKLSSHAWIWVVTC